MIRNMKIVMKKRITFVLNMPTLKIVGGYKMVYEYASYLASKDYAVTIVYNAMNGNNSMKLPRKLVYVIRKLLGKIGPFWYKLDKRVKKVTAKTIEDKYCPEADIIFATAVGTAKLVYDLSEEKGQKCYFVQGFENWRLSDDEVIETYRYKMKKIAVSKWLKDKIESYVDEEVTYITNGINSETFKSQIENCYRQNHTIAMLYHKDYVKGCDTALKVLYRLKERYADLKVYMFGSPKKEEWPEWIDYTHNAKPKEVAALMNKSKVFLSTSRNEGFGLTGLESLFCDCVLVTTKNLGVMEYANEDNAFLCEVDNVDEIYDNVCVAFDNNEICNEKLNKSRLVKNDFDNKFSMQKFEEFIENC